MAATIRSAGTLDLDRRKALLLAMGGTAGLALASQAGAQTAPPQTSDTPETPADGATPAPDLAPYAPGWRSYAVGEARVTVVLDGARPGGPAYPTFGADQQADTVADLLEANLLPRERSVGFYNVAVIETGGQLIVIDTGFGAAGREQGAGLLVERLRAAGHAPEDVDLVLLTHFHGDHILGISQDGVPTFPNATYGVGRVEYDFFTSPEAAQGGSADHAERVAQLIVPLGDAIRYLEDGEEVVPGLIARAAFGHTPGMLAFEVAGGDGPDLLVVGDTFHHPVVSLQRPDWQVEYDMDHDAAAATRRRIAADLAESGAALLAYHFPFPGVGFVQVEGDAFRFVPETIQFAAAAAD